MAQFALDTGVSILTFFEGYFSISYPLPKQDMFAIPDFAAGAMENWGLITYRESSFLYDSSISTTSNLQRVGIIVSHELAHQWFGNLVTPSWWTDLWLNEGFASYMEYIGLNHAQPSWNMLDQFVTVDLQHVMGVDALSSSHPISIPVENPSEINEIFDDISYSKGASIIRMMSHFLTEATFNAGITNYLNGRAYMAADQSQLWEYLTVEAHRTGTLPADVTVQEIMDTWTLQMGFPVVTVTRTGDGTTATVTQNHFLLSSEASSNSTWWVPLTYFVQSDDGYDVIDETNWLVDTEMDITGLPPSQNWVIFNFQQTGYYRVNYDINNWNSIINQLSTDHSIISAINRAQILDDAANLARAGLLSYKTALDAHVYLSEEKDYVPWYSVIRNMKYIESMFSSTANYSIMQEALQNQVVTRYNDLGFTEGLEDSHLTLLQRTLIVSWACLLELPDCLTTAGTLFENWVTAGGLETTVAANLKSTVYCVGIAEGTSADWDFAWQVARSTNLASERDLLLSALGCSKNQTILANYLEMAFTEDSGVRKQDSSRVFAAVASNDEGRQLAWDYLNLNFEAITAYSNSFLNAGSYIEAATEELNTAEELNELIAFKTKYSEILGSAARATDQAIERVSTNVAWMQANYDLLLDLVASATSMSG
ncbi:Peptidase M1 membrane alanine aminopeptidase N-terminal [Trinorchestia longiramus]|nr:Peptidase M1 membrane alanine aminopeptidase N-terminal [Trinorchestia longiramus]